MKKNILLAAAAALALLAQPLFAKTYTCEMDPVNNRVWIPEVVVVNHDEATGKVVALDPIIKHFTGGPIVGEVTTNNAKRITFKWTIKDMTATGGGQRSFVPGFRFSLTVQHATHKASMFSTPLGYTNRDHGEGRCTVK